MEVAKLGGRQNAKRRRRDLSSDVAVEEKREAIIMMLFLGEESQICVKEKIIQTKCLLSLKTVYAQKQRKRISNHTPQYTV